MILLHTLQNLIFIISSCTSVLSMPYATTSVLAYRADPKMQMKVGMYTALVGLYLRFFQKRDHFKVKYEHAISYYVLMFLGRG
jgi:hypothetical protein